jgi:hypothetical protein
MMVRFLGGVETNGQQHLSSNSNSKGRGQDLTSVAEGIKLVADFGIANVVLSSESNVNRFRSVTFLRVPNSSPPRSMAASIFT